MCRTLLASLLVLVVLFLVASPLAADEPPDRLDDAKASLIQLAAWFESLPPDERAAAARELRRWLEKTYGSEVPFPFALPSEEQIATWESAGSDQAGPKTDTVPALPTDEVEPAAGPESTTDAAPTEPQAEAPPEPAVPKTPQPPGRCNTLLPFDTDGDGTLTGLDRYWRHLYLWLDSDGDRKPADGEMVSPFDYEIREIGLDLRYFVAGKGKKASRGEIETDEYILVDAKQDGFRATLYPAGDDAALAVDADALRRDPKGLDLRDASGAEITGIQPFVRGWTIVDRDGASVEVDCPD